MSFLKAEWRKLAVFNYVIDPAVLAPYIPAGTTIDLWEDKCYVSLIGFYFAETRLKGIKVPGHVNFEEVNLRFYVKRTLADEVRHGVAFVKEIVSKPMLVFVANTVYKENYARHPMHYSWNISDTHQKIEYAWKSKGRWNTLRVEAENQALDIPVGSEAEFITEHYWGYARHNDRKSVEYAVTHDRWQHYKLLSTCVDVDFGTTYGPSFAFLNHETPQSVYLVEGSPITVEPADSFTLSL